MRQSLQSVFESFETGVRFISFSPMGKGNIHDTYRVETSEGMFILQRLNRVAFKDTPGLMENLSRITSHLREKTRALNIPWTVPAFYSTRDGNKAWYEDDEAEHWRLMDYIPHQPVSSAHESIYLDAGKAYGLYNFLLSDLPGKALNATIPGFHDMYGRWDQFDQALKGAETARKEKAAFEIDAVLGMKSDMERIPRLIRSGEVPVRITHNDTKLDNILFNENSEVCSIIDYDTTMPGSIHSDFGDSLRSMACALPEDSPDFGNLRFRTEVFEDYSNGFFNSAYSMLTPSESQSLALAPAYFAYMQAVRFLADYLNGDVYYKIRYGEHNLVRAGNQVRLALEIHRHEGQMIELHQDICKKLKNKEAEL